MEGSRSTILSWIGIMTAIMTVSARCGQERREEKYETQKDAAVDKTTKVDTGT